VFLEVFDLNVPERARIRKILLQELYPGLAVGSAAVVLPRRQFMSNHAITNDQA